MGDLSTHFSRSEFACRCGCGFDTADHELVCLLEDIRLHFNSQVIITGPNRCLWHNQEAGGARNSQHLYAKAADIVVVGVDADLVAGFLENRHPDRYGIGRYGNRTHVDVRRPKARWEK